MKQMMRFIMKIKISLEERDYKYHRRLFRYTGNFNAICKILGRRICNVWFIGHGDAFVLEPNVMSQHIIIRMMK